MKCGFIFYHGLGYDQYYWNNLLPFFKQFPCFVYDAGYYKNAFNPEDSIKNYNNDIIWIGIGHSIGFGKLLEKHRQKSINLSGIIALQGFSNFLGNSFYIRNIRTTVLDTIIADFKRAPLDSIKKFINDCGFDAKQKYYTQLMEKTKNINEIDVELFLQDFNLLKNKFFIPQDLHCLIIAGENDPVVDRTLVHDNFDGNLYDIKFINCNGHILGYSNAKEVYELIMNFIKNNTHNASMPSI